MKPGDKPGIGLVLLALVSGCEGSVVLEFGGGSGGSDGGSDAGGTGPGGAGPGGAEPGCRDGQPCDDGLFCTSASICEDGHCVGTSEIVCPPPAPCRDGFCDESIDQCISVFSDDGLSCDDGDPCTGDGTCQSGECGGGITLCDEFDDQCNDGVCTVMGCETEPKPNGTVCNDGDRCTSIDTCAAGLCVGSGGPVVYFSDDFSDNAAGWTLGLEWAVGATAVSVGHSWGNADPANDTSPTADNGVAGAVLGGNVNVNMSHDYRWLESPSFDTTIDPGPVILNFQRFLNSDWDPWMNNRIQVWNGSTWIIAWESGSTPVTDAAWTEVTLDLTAYKNAAMRVRFGFNIGTFGGTFVVAGWNIDDLSVATSACN